LSLFVLSSLALKGVLEKSRADFEKSLGTPLELHFDATQAIVPRLSAGFRADLVILGLAVAAGEAEIGVQQHCELEPVPGIDIVGPLPEPIQRVTHFSAGIPASAANAQAASALMVRLRL
jgi:ABC-type molybdate transport system substrate-binding protein